VNDFQLQIVGWELYQNKNCHLNKMEYRLVDPKWQYDSTLVEQRLDLRIEGAQPDTLIIDPNLHVNSFRPIFGYNTNVGYQFRGLDNNDVLFTRPEQHIEEGQVPGQVVIVLDDASVSGSVDLYRQGRRFTLMEDIQERWALYPDQAFCKSLGPNNGIIGIATLQYQAKYERTKENPNPAIANPQPQVRDFEFYDDDACQGNMLYDTTIHGISKFDKETYERRWPTPADEGYTIVNARSVKHLLHEWPLDDDAGDDTASVHSEDVVIKKVSTQEKKDSQETRNQLNIYPMIEER